MIIFNKESKTLFSPSNLNLDRQPQKCLLIFDDEIWKDLILNDKSLESQPVRNNFGRIFNTYRYLKYHDKDVLLVYPSMGASAAVCDFELLIASGLKSFVMFGTCGCLDKDIAQNTIIIPRAAIREEGTSYHYLPDNEEVEVNRNYLKICQDAFNHHNLTNTIGKIWTTDAVYRETFNKVQMMQKRLYWRRYGIIRYASASRLSEG